MKPVFQSDLTPTHGNCFSACLASVLELALDDVPNFYDIAPHEPVAWWAAVRGWLAPRGWGLLNVTIPDQWPPELIGTFIVCGKTSRHTDHAVVYQDGTLAHDPFPGGNGLERIDTVDLLYPLDPARLKLHHA